MNPRPLLALLFGAALAASAQTPPAETSSYAPPAEPEAPRVLTPPAFPAHARKSLDSPSELARDFAEVVTFLEQGQSYFRAYQKGSHTPEENKQFLAFLEAYERESAVARKEADALRKWVLEQSALDK
ncbi:MAG: hypothetical protein FD126_131 [Elusimicrobia bacterium]|nr:MAG: hypothetical protein FD126_131 [Elusimicrobiota bacterium]